MKVIIGGIPYEIKRVRGLCTADGQKLNGQIDCQEFIIRLETDLTPMAAQQTLWHEIMHGIMMQSGRQKHEEELIDMLAYGVMGVLLSNRNLTDL